VKFDKDTVCGFWDFNDHLPLKKEKFTPLDKTFFPGAFTYHMHLKDCGNTIRNTSFFVYFEETFGSKLGISLDEKKL
jgi:hypothetical protein